MRYINPKTDFVFKKTAEEIEDAFGIAEAAKLTPEEDHALEQKMHWIADQRALLAMKQQVESQLEQTSNQLEQTSTQLAETSTQLAETSTQLAQKNQQLLAARAVLREMGLSEEEITRRLGA